MFVKAEKGGNSHMKKNSTMILFLTLVTLTFTGCGKNSQESAKQLAENGTEQVSETQEIASETQETVTEITETAASEKTSETDTTVSQNTTEGTEKKGTVEVADYDSKAIAENLIKEESKRKIVIYLPPSYYESDKSYPVVYYLHGFSEEGGSFVRSAGSQLDKVFAADPSKEFIMVAVDGANSLGGSFYVNSPVIGNWEDYTAEEVVSYIDSTYRTIASADARGICGFSMGGFAALNLAFRHPDVYGAVYAMSPGVIAPGKIEDALDTWDRTFQKAYSLAFAYNKKAPYENIAARDGSDEDNALLEKLETGFGDWESKLDDYLKKDTPLRGIGMSYGTGDGYRWIPEGTEYLSGLLDEKGIDHVLFSFDKGHMVPPHAVMEHLLPFFQENLVWE